MLLPVSLRNVLRTQLLHTRRFSEPTFRPSGACFEKTVFRDVSALSRSLIFFLLTLSSLSLSLLTFSILTGFSSVSFFALTVPKTVAASVHKSEV